MATFAPVMVEGPPVFKKLVRSTKIGGLNKKIELKVFLHSGESHAAQLLREPHPINRCAPGSHLEESSCKTLKI